MSSPDTLELEVRIMIRQPGRGCFQGLEICERLAIENKTFMELCAILGQFQALTERIHMEEQCEKSK